MCYKNPRNATVSRTAKNKRRDLLVWSREREAVAPSLLVDTTDGLRPNPNISNGLDWSQCFHSSQTTKMQNRKGIRQNTIKMNSLFNMRSKTEKIGKKSFLLFFFSFFGSEIAPEGLEGEQRNHGISFRKTESCLQNSFMLLSIQFSLFLPPLNAYANAFSAWDS